MAIGRKTGGGSRKGCPNKPKTFEAGLLQAVEGLGESDYKRILQLALTAIENEIFVESADGQSTVRKVIYNFEPLKAILPYVARKRPDKDPAGGPLPPILDCLRKELEEYAAPDDPPAA